MSYAVSDKEATVSEFLSSIEIKSEADYEQRLEYVEHLMDRVDAGDDLALPILDYVSKLVEAYEDEHYPMGESSPGKMLAYFMEHNGHKQKDLADIATQSVISDILNAKRVPTPEQVKKLAKKYNTNPAVFI